MAHNHRACLPMIQFHHLRHTAASLMLNRNIPAIVVSKRLAHTKPSTILDIYGHLMPEGQDEAAKLMDELITSIPVEIPSSMPVERTSPTAEKTTAPLRYKRPETTT